MSQVEIAGGALTLPHELPSKGHCLRDFEGIATDGRVIHLSDYRGLANLVVIAVDCREETTRLVQEMAREYEKLHEQEADVLLIVRTSGEESARTTGELKLPFPILADVEGRIHRMLGATDSQEQDIAAVYVTDRFGEVFGSYRVREKQRLPALVDILSWLEFINNQCPECEPPEWPLDGQTDSVEQKE